MKRATTTIRVACRCGRTMRTWIGEYAMCGKCYLPMAAIAKQKSN